MLACIGFKQEHQDPLFIWKVAQWDFAHPLYPSAVPLRRLRQPSSAAGAPAALPLLALPLTTLSTIRNGVSTSRHPEREISPLRRKKGRGNRAATLQPRAAAVWHDCKMPGTTQPAHGPWMDLLVQGWTWTLASCRGRSSPGGLPEKSKADGLPEDKLLCQHRARACLSGTLITGTV